MNKEEIKSVGQAYLQVQENQKAALQKKLAKSAQSSEKGKAAVTLPKPPFEIPEDVPVDERDMFMAKAAAAHKAGKTHFTMPGGKKHPVTMKKDTAKAVNSEMSSKEKMKRGLYNSANEAKDLDTGNAEKAIKHDCATHVEHAEWGEGNPISGQHTIVETSPGHGYVTHYDVMFEHGLEKDVSVEDLKILAESSHGHSRKKKMKSEAEVEMNPKKKTDKNMVSGTYESKMPTVYARILENRAAHYKSATPPQDKEDGMAPMTKKTKADMEKGMVPNDTEEKGHDDASKAGRAGPSMKARRNDNMKGDKKIIPSATPMKGM